jgi:hypothetical protein
MSYGTDLADMAVTSEAKKLMPVTLPPGRARLATRPNRATEEHPRFGQSPVQLLPPFIILALASVFFD